MIRLSPLCLAIVLTVLMDVNIASAQYSDFAPPLPQPSLTLKAAASILKECRSKIDEAARRETKWGVTLIDRHSPDSLQAEAYFKDSLAMQSDEKRLEPYQPKAKLPYADYLNTRYAVMQTIESFSVYRQVSIWECDWNMRTASVTKVRKR
jgi:hypothetical protein